MHIQEDFLDRSLTLACLQDHVSTLCGDLIIVTGSEPRVQEFQRGVDFVVVIRSEPVQGAESLSILIRTTLVTFFPILDAFK